MKERVLGDIIKSMCERYNLNYEENKEKIAMMLFKKYITTGETITDADCNEVWKLIVAGE
jgi:hypothetical protein